MSRSSGLVHTPWGLVGSVGGRRTGETVEVGQGGGVFPPDASVTEGVDVDGVPFVLGRKGLPP